MASRDAAFTSLLSLPLLLSASCYLPKGCSKAPNAEIEELQGALDMLLLSGWNPGNSRAPAVDPQQLWQHWLQSLSFS